MISSIEEAVASIRKKNGASYVPVVPEVRADQMYTVTAHRPRRLLSRKTIAEGFMAAPEDQVYFICLCLGTMIAFSQIEPLEDEFIRAGLYHGSARKYCDMARRAFQLWRKRVFCNPQVERLLQLMNQHISDHLLEYRQYYRTQSFNYAGRLGSPYPGILSAYYACVQFVAYAHTVLELMPGLNPSVFDPVPMLHAIENSINDLHLGPDGGIRWTDSPDLVDLGARLNNVLAQDAIRIHNIMAETDL